MFASKTKFSAPAFVLGFYGKNLTSVSDPGRGTIDRELDGR
jgi:hypothetical protein